MTIQFDRLILEHTLATLAATLPDASTLFPVPSQIHLFETVDSTNRAAWKLLRQGATASSVVIAMNQTAGKGQRGHQWSSPVGGLYLSLTLTPDLPANCGTHLTMASAWGIASALRQQGIPVGIKWLNDLVVDERKLGGILTETRLAQQRIRQVVIGVGINWQNPVPQVGINLQSVLARQENRSIQSLEMLAAVVIFGLIKGYFEYRQQGLETLLSGYHELLTSLGHSVAINRCGTVVSGTVIGVSRQGELRVQLSASPGATETVVMAKPGEFSLGYG